jgi:hypothetical protein
MTMGIAVDYCNSIQMMLGLMEAIADKLAFVLRKGQGNMGNIEKYHKMI